MDARAGDPEGSADFFLGEAEHFACLAQTAGDDRDFVAVDGVRQRFLLVLSWSWGWDGCDGEGDSEAAFVTERNRPVDDVKFICALLR